MAAARGLLSRRFGLDRNRIVQRSAGRVQPESGPVTSAVFRFRFGLRDRSAARFANGGRQGSPQLVPWLNRPLKPVQCEGRAVLSVESDTRRAKVWWVLASSSKSADAEWQGAAPSSIHTSAEIRPGEPLTTPGAHNILSEPTSIHVSSLGRRRALRSFTYLLTIFNPQFRKATLRPAKQSKMRVLTLAIIPCLAAGVLAHGDHEHGSGSQKPMVADDADWTTRHMAGAPYRYALFSQCVHILTRCDRGAPHVLLGRRLLLHTSRL